MKRLLLLGIIILAGCNGDKATQTGNGQSAAGGGTATSAESLRVPDELKHAGFEYYGLGRSEPIDYEMQVEGQAEQLLTGGQSAKLQSVEDGKAVFLIERTGEIASKLGASQEVMLQKDGIYVTKASPLDLKEPQLELPADLAPGKTWKQRTEAQTNGVQFVLDAQYKAVREETVKTKAGEVPALLVTFEGNGSQGDSKFTIKGKNWYAKGVGSVKMEMETTGADGTKQTVILQQTE